MGKIYAAKTNHITNPIGFNMDSVAFSWKVKGCRGQEQKHARIVISKNKTFTDICEGFVLADHNPCMFLFLSSASFHFP